MILGVFFEIKMKKTAILVDAGFFQKNKNSWHRVFI